MYYMLKRFIIASIRILVLQDNILTLQKSIEILKHLNAPISTLMEVKATVNTLSVKKEILKDYVKSRLQLLVLDCPEYDIDDFGHLTRKDIEKGYLQLNDTTILSLTTGDVIRIKAVIKPMPSPIEIFKITWPI